MSAPLEAAVDVTVDPAAAGTPASAPPAAVGMLRERLGDSVRAVMENRGQFRVLVDRAHADEAISFLRDDPRCRFTFLVDVTAIDFHGVAPASARYRVTWVLRSYQTKETLVLQSDLPDDDPTVASMTHLFPGADWLERECFDMFGIRFAGHPDMRRILLPDIFPGHPLRKDYPMTGIMTDQEWAEHIVSRAQREEGHD